MIGGYRMRLASLCWPERSRWWDNPKIFPDQLVKRTVAIVDIPHTFYRSIYACMHTLIFMHKYNTAVEK